MKTYIIDTNIILDSLENLFKLYNSENKIVICDTVIDEVDSKKSGLDELGYRAREFARFLDSLSIDSVETDNDITITKLSNKSIKLELFSKSEYAADSKYAKSPAILADRKIIECCKYYESGILVSLDTMCRLRAICESINAQTLKGNYETNSFEFLKKFDISDVPDIFLNDSGEIDNGTDVEIIDPNYKVENFSYFVNYPTGQSKIYQVYNKKLYLLDEAKIEKQDIKPINLGQKIMSDAILNDFTNIIVVNSLAGSGKTVVSISNAMKLVKDKKYNKIVYIRNSIESVSPGEDVGYLPGLEEKFAVYNHPLFDTLRFIAKEQLKKSNSNKAIKDHIDESKIEEKAKELQKKYNIETMWIGELRGRTISDAVVIMDEFQNFSKKSAVTAISRLDKNCKLIVIGSNNQIDNPYINKFINGLTCLLNAAKLENPEVNLFACNLTKVVRGPITEFAERVFKL